jgi:hypothetical protein
VKTRVSSTAVLKCGPMVMGWQGSERDAEDSKELVGWAPVVHAYNPSYSGGDKEH